MEFQETTGSQPQPMWYHKLLNITLPLLTSMSQGASKHVGWVKAWPALHTTGSSPCLSVSVQKNHTFSTIFSHIPLLIT